MDEICIELLTAKHMVGTFDCGKPSLNDFVRLHAATNQDRGVSRVYVAVRFSSPQILAYYACSAGTFSRDNLPAKDQIGLPRYPLPTVHLGRLAVDKVSQGQRLGKLLLFHFLQAACNVAETIGVVAADLYSKDDTAKRFYQKYGFTPMQKDEYHLFLPMTSVRAMLAPSANPGLAAE